MKKEFYICSQLEDSLLVKEKHLSAAGTTNKGKTAKYICTYKKTVYDTKPSIFGRIGDIEWLV